MNVFDIIPSDFFNCLAGNSNNRVYADCLELIHNQYDKEISYRLERSYLRDVLAAFYWKIIWTCLMKKTLQMQETMKLTLF